MVPESGDIYGYSVPPLVRQKYINKGRLQLSDNVACFFQKTVIPFRNRAKIDCPKEFLGRTI